MLRKLPFMYSITTSQKPSLPIHPKLESDDGQTAEEIERETARIRQELEKERMHKVSLDLIMLIQYSKGRKILYYF